MSFVPRSLDELDLRWPPELDHFSASSAKMAVRCPEQWRQRYVQGKKLPPALAIMAGKADHVAIEKSMAQKVETFVDLPVGEVKDAFLETLETDVDWAGGIQEVEVNKAETKQDKIDAYDELRRSGPAVVAAYHTQASPFIQPLAVEKYVETTIPGLPVKMIGYIDLIAVGVPDQNLLDLSITPDRRIIDRKRRNRSSRKIEPEWAIQAEVYQYCEPLPHEWHLSITTKTPHILMGGEGLVQPLRKRDLLEKQLQHIVGSIGFYYMRYGPDEPWPAQGRLHPWACGYCGFRDGCWAWA